ncbi:MAG TPA: glycosyltransferase family 4 protein, partial [Tepidisphaeraceae bacterium]
FSSYNGVGYHMGRALTHAGIELDYLGPLRETYRWWLGPKQQFIRRCVRKLYNRHREALACRDYSKQIDAKLRGGRHDAVFSSLSCGSQPVAYLQTSLPIVIWTDCTLASAVNFYPDFTREKAVWSNIEAGIRNEREAIHRASLLIYSSDWARREAIEQYQINPERVKVAPFGANEEHTPDRAEVQRLIESRPADVCRLLFVGMDWHRKGGDMAMQTAAELHRRGVPVELTLVGSNPPGAGPLPEYVKPMGLITRRNPEGARRLEELFAQAHFLILASRADASPHVLVEANSFGVPCASSNVGGIPSIIQDGINGQMFDRDANPEQYADWITEMFARPNEYRRLAWSSFEEYEARLNWDSAGVKVSKMLQQLLGRPELPPISVRPAPVRASA